MDIMSYNAGDYRALADFLDARASEIEAVMPPVVKAATSVTFDGKFASRAKAQLSGFRADADSGADAVRNAATVARQRASDLEAEQAKELARRAAQAARELWERTQRLLGGN